MKHIMLITLFILFISFISCNEIKLGKAYQLIKIEDKLKKSTAEKCFRSSLVFFDEKQYKITFPGFKNPMDKGSYLLLKNSKLKIENLKDCYFNGEYEMTLTEKNMNKYLILNNDLIEIVCKEVDFSKGGINQSVFRKFLDTLSWNSEYCKDFRQRLCDN